MHSIQPHKTSHLFSKIIPDGDFFTLTKSAHLSDSEKANRRHHMMIVVMLQFINHDLPYLLPHADLEELERLTEKPEAIDFSIVERFFEVKVPHYRHFMSNKMYQLKKQLIENHYRYELKTCELDERFKGKNRLQQILAIKRILQGIQEEDWASVKQTVPYTLISTTH